MRKIIFICFGLWICTLLAQADTFQLNDGKTVTGEPLWSTASETELTVRVGDGEYQKIPWTSFSQDDLKKFQSNAKLAPLVEPFIEIPASEKIKRTEVEIKPVPRLDRPAKGSLIGAMFSSSLGVVVLLVLYAANIYAAFEIAVFRARPRVMVCLLSAVLPVVAPIIFLSMPTLIEPAGDEDEQSAGTPATPPGNGAAQAAAAVQSRASSIPDSDPLAPDPAKTPKAKTGGLHIAHAAEAAPAGTTLPPPQVFQRGAFTFNRRFIETKFPGFFGVVRRDAEKDMVLVIKSARGEYVGRRITRITGADFHLEVHKGNATEEVLIPFTEIKEIKLQHKDAP